MLKTSFNREEYEKGRIERHKIEGLRFVPEGTGPKVYCVVCADASDWDEVHNYIINENEIDGIPNRKIECVDPNKICDRMGSYEISDAEANQLRNHPKVIGVNIDEGYYEGTYKGKDTYPMSQPSSKINRYGSSVKISRDTSGSGHNSGNDSSWLSKTAAQIYRHQTLADPWKNSGGQQGDNTVITDNIEQYGDGTDVDVIVTDSASWFGHIEFVKTGVGEPSNFVGTNVLKSGFASSATTGVCGVLDLVLHAPYYIDPDFFEADPSNRLRVRWDGTTVPVDSVAADWWYYESTSYRSAKFVGTNSGGTATIGSNEDFGSIYVNDTYYTEAIHNGTNVGLHTGQYDGSLADHGTPCMSQSYGKTHGWAYNANKWFISVFWASGAISSSVLYNMIKVFHNLKPNRASDNTKNPTLTSNSWGAQITFNDGEYAYWRTNGDGTGEESITVSGTAISPEWLDNFYYNNEHVQWIAPTNSTMVRGASMIDAGVIFVAGSGNNNNQLVKGDHANYNNYVSSSSTRTLSQAENGYEMVNRPGSPLCIGVVRNYNSTGIDTYRTFAAGALNDNLSLNNNGSYYEQKVTYSNMGNAIDFYTIGDDSYGAQGGGSNNYPRNDSSYRLDSNYNIVSSGGTLSLTSYDRRFGGTSSACPVGAGLIATKLQHNRTWAWSDIKHWLATRVTNQSGDTDFFQGTEATSSSDSNWSSQTNLQGSERKILWDATTEETVSSESEDPKCTLSGSITISGGNLNIT